MEKVSVKFDWPKEAVVKMVEMWQKYECLYNPKHKFYHNKHARHAAFSEIAEELQKLNFNIETTEIKNKMTYLRGQYTREVAKIKEKKSGSGAEDNYIPSAYWFNELTFLNDFIRIRKGGCNLNAEVCFDDSLSSPQSSVCVESPPPYKKIRTKDVRQGSSTSAYEENEALSAATSVLKKLATETNMFDVQDESFCNYIKTELFQIKSSEIKDELKELITLEIFKAKKKQRIQDESNVNLNSL